MTQRNHEAGNKATPLSYADAGVDLTASNAAKDGIRKLVESTYTAGARGAYGGFGGMFKMPSDLKDPLIVSSADGVGTKIKVAIEADRHNTIGHDLVNHCVNDILVQGARPMFFLDYVAFGKLIPEVVEQVVEGVAAGCRENGCALMGGETAEMPGLYTPPDYDLAGFIVGCVEEKKVLGSDGVKDGDVLVGLASNGLHTNGYSLARKIVSDRMQLSVHDRYPGLDVTVADALLLVHASYLKALEPVLDRVNALAHITGGGIPGNLNRALPDNLDAHVDTSRWEVPVLFKKLQEAGEIAQNEMFRTFNMGIGMIVICNKEHVDTVISSAGNDNVDAFVIGRVGAGSGKVHIE